MKVKIVYVTDEGEFEIGPFNQGVVFDVEKDHMMMAPMTLRDVATGGAIMRARYESWFIEGEDHAAIQRFFIQGYTN